MSTSLPLSYFSLQKMQFFIYLFTVKHQFIPRASKKIEGFFTGAVYFTHIYKTIYLSSRLDVSIQIYIPIYRYFFHSTWIKMPYFFLFLEVFQLYCRKKPQTHRLRFVSCFLPSFPFH